MIFIWLLQVYLLVGVLFAFYFVIKGVAVVDEDAARGSFWLKVLLFPGSVLLWPVLIAKLKRRG